MKNLNVIFIISVMTCLCLSACSPQEVGSYNNPSTQITAAPGESITDIDSIVSKLNELAEKNVSMFQEEGWWRRSNEVVSQTGNLNSANHVEWMHLSQNPDECMSRMDIIEEPSSGDIILLQMQIPEGYMGELVSLRQGTSEVTKVDPSICRLTEATTEAGYLALSLQGNASEKDSRAAVEWAKAWYEDRDGKPAFIVFAGFTTPFEKLTTQTETYSFDVQSGMVLEHYLTMGYDFGMEMGSLDIQSRYELWEKLPEDVAVRFELSTEELKKYVDNPPAKPFIDITPQPTAQPLDLESTMKPYKEETPLTDETQAMAVMQEIVRRRTAWVARPGWLLQKTYWPGGKDYTHEQYTLVHVTGDNGECQEQMVYFYKDGALSPWIVRLADGTSGMVPSWDKSSGNVRSNVKENTFCSLYNGESVFMEGDFLFVDEIANLQKFTQDTKNGLIKGDFKIYADELDNRPVLVLAYRSENDPISGGLVMDSSTQELVHYTQNNQLHYFDMETGMPVWLVDRFTLENGSVDDGGGGLEYTWQFYTELPDELAQAYTRAAAELESYSK